MPTTTTSAPASAGVASFRGLSREADASDACGPGRLDVRGRVADEHQGGRLDAQSPGDGEQWVRIGLHEVGPKDRTPDHGIDRSADALIARYSRTRAQRCLHFG
ncbi:hypothetical protein VR46_11160 [Streptomyces sp. NRRL S-444]|nr:hypothetical protein VR46_11160 [Streptomyces sp. NRRL S-444]